MTKTMFRKEMSKLSSFIRQTNDAQRNICNLIGIHETSKESIFHSMVVFCIRQLSARTDDKLNLIHDYFFGKIMFTGVELNGKTYPCNSPAQLWETITAWNRYVDSEIIAEHS
jgi:hypothetical protein